MTTPTPSQTPSSFVTLRCGARLGPLGVDRCTTRIATIYDDGAGKLKWVWQRGEPALRGVKASANPDSSFTQEGFIDSDALVSRHNLKCRSRCGADYTELRSRLLFLYRQARADGVDEVWLAEN